MGEISDADNELAEVFFACARYERPSTDWRDALIAYKRALSAEPARPVAWMCERTEADRPFRTFRIYCGEESSAIKNKKEGWTVTPLYALPADPRPSVAGRQEVSRVLIACEFSGTVRDAFAALGHDAWSCDLLPTERPGKHFQGDVRGILGHGWDLMVAHPPCTYLSRAGARWWKDADRQALADAAAEFVFALRDAPVEHIAIENPIGQLNRRWRYPDQTIQPHEFGEPYSKATCLWLKNLPPLIPTHVGAGDWFSQERPAYVPFLPSNTGGAKRGQKATQGAVHGGKDASRTFQGIAQAMAAQWGSLPRTNGHASKSRFRMTHRTPAGEGRG